MDAGPRGLTGIQGDSLHTGISRPITGRRREPPDRYGREVRNHCSVERPCKVTVIIIPAQYNEPEQDLADVGESTDRLGTKIDPQNQKYCKLYYFEIVSTLSITPLV